MILADINISTDAGLAALAVIGGGFTALWFWAKKQNDKLTAALQQVIKDEREMIERRINMDNTVAAALDGVARSMDNQQIVIKEIQDTIEKCDGLPRADEP